MATNLYFSQKVRSEQNLYEDIVIESLKIYGQDVYYLPRDIVNEDRILGDDVPSRFNSSHKIEMYIENVDGFDGEGDLFSRFGVEIRDEATFVISRKRWEQQVARYDNEISSTRPIEGDLVYLPLSNSLFQIMHVEHEQPFYQLSNLPIYKMRCQLFEYNDEDLDTGIEIIDDIEKQYAYTYVLTLSTTRDSAQAGATIDSNGLINSVQITDSGDGYFTSPLISITPGGGGGVLTPIVDSDNGKIKSVTIATGGTYGSPPTLTFGDPSPTLFTVGETVRMKLASTTLTGEVSKYSDSDNKLHIIHAGAADGKYHAFTTNKSVVGLTSGAGGVVTAVFEDNKISSNEQNTDFSPSGLSFLDFTENNPFGDPENN
mgnify:CR=1 FL=1